MEIKQSTARNLMVLMVDSADHVTGKTGLTLTITASKDGAAFASITPTVTERGDGWYSLALTTTHTNTLGDFCLHVTSSGADPTDARIEIVLDLSGASVSSVTGAVGSVTAAVNVGLSTLEQLWDALVGDHTVSGSFGQRMARIPNAGAGANGGLPTVNASNYVAGIAGTINTLDGIAAGIWNALTSGLTTVGSIGKLLVDNVTASIAAVKAKTDNLPSDPADASDIAALIDALPTAAENAAALLDLANGIETSVTPRQAIRLMLAAVAGKLSGAATTTVTIRNVGDTKARITATVDADGNRTAVTTDGT